MIAIEKGLALQFIAIRFSLLACIQNYATNSIWCAHGLCTNFSSPSFDQWQNLTFEDRGRLGIGEMLRNVSIWVTFVFLQLVPHQTHQTLIFAPDYRYHFTNPFHRTDSRYERKSTALGKFNVKLTARKLNWSSLIEWLIVLLECDWIAFAQMNGLLQFDCLDDTLMAFSVLCLAQQNKTKYVHKVAIESVRARRLAYWAHNYSDLHFGAVINTIYKYIVR